MIAGEDINQGASPYWVSPSISSFILVGAAATSGLHFGAGLRNVRRRHRLSS
jgi:hypothetical protein